MKEKNVLLIIVIVAILANILSTLFCFKLLEENIKQLKEIKSLEYQLEYVCEKL